MLFKKTIFAKRLFDWLIVRMWPNEMLSLLLCDWYAAAEMMGHSLLNDLMFGQRNGIAPKANAVLSSAFKLKLRKDSLDILRKNTKVSKRIHVHFLSPLLLTAAVIESGMRAPVDAGGRREID
jgi:hypothetical protein